MKILYDHQIFTSQVYGGISRYFFELMDCFHAEGEVGFELALRYSNNSYLRRAAWAHCKPFFPERRFLGKTTLLNALNGMTSGRSIRSGKYDIFHPTYYHPYFLHLVGTRPVVVTVYDFTHELYPELFAADDRTVAWKQAVLARADRIIAISTNTKNDLLRLYRVAEERVEVVHLAASMNANRNLPLETAIPPRYLLFVGQRGGYKNFPLFARALVPVLRNDPELFIVCAGGGAFSHGELQMLAALGIESRVRQFPAGDELLLSLYRGAVAFVFPSLYEGFGIPVLEAFASGCPALLSNRSSLPEIGGEAALYFDPEDEESLRDAVASLLGSEAVRDSLMARGKKRVEEFSWKRVARETKVVYENL